MKISILITAVFILMSSCAKKIDCDNAKLCVINVGNNTINYCWGCNSYTEILLPGEKTCIDVGPLHVKSNDGYYSVYYFDADGTTHAIQMNNCYVEKQIE